MLYEDDVVEAVCRYLERNDYVIRQSLTPVQRGHDIIADKQGDPTWTLYVEAKGEGSSKLTTARYGSSFNSRQVFDHVAKAVLKALRVASWDTTSPPSRAGIALPETPPTSNRSKWCAERYETSGSPCSGSTKRRTYTSKPHGRSNSSGYAPST